MRPGRLEAVSRNEAAADGFGPAETKYAGLLNPRASEPKFPAHPEVADAFVAAVITVNYFNRQPPARSSR